MEFNLAAGGSITIFDTEVYYSAARNNALSNFLSSSQLSWICQGLLESSMHTTNPS